MAIECSHFYYIVVIMWISQHCLRIEEVKKNCIPIPEEREL